MMIRRLADPIVDSLYARWLVNGDHTLGLGMAGPDRGVISAGQFVARELPFSYEQFGDFVGVC